MEEKAGKGGEVVTVERTMIVEISNGWRQLRGGRGWPLGKP